MENSSTNSSYSSIIELVRHSWAEYAQEIAMDNGVDKLTFKELEEKVSALSSLILTVAPDEEVVALTTSRGFQLIINMLAVLNAGKTYVPIDPSFPIARINQIVEDCGVKYYLKSNESDFLDLIAVDINGVPERPLASAKSYTKLAYILYTSGSTGKPKGVCVPHDGIINLINWQVENSVSKPGMKTLQFTRLTFDISVQEIFSTLCSGGTLQLVDVEVIRDYSALVQVLNEQKIQRLFLPFVALQGIANESESSSLYPEFLQEVMTCGEQLKSTRAVKALFSKMKTAKLFNQYGPTECTCIVTQLELPADPGSWDDLPTIGKAISGVESLILDSRRNVITEPNVEGELYFSGVCLADGYLNKSELTKKSFFPLTLEDGTTRMVYKTGDLGYYTGEKEIFFLGRIDDQVKISGFRIETGEIEAVAAALPGVAQVAVIVGEYEDGQKYLSLFYVSPEDGVQEAEMIAFLKERLPAYMIPTACVRKDSFPQTSNGKIDRKSLSERILRVNPFKDSYTKPRGKTETELAKIWEEILNLDQVGRDNHFFELGGSSFLAQRMAIAINKAFGKEFGVSKIYQYPKLKAQASYLLGEEKGAKAHVSRKTGNGGNNRDVAIIATASRFPGAANTNEFWEMVKNGKETIRFFDMEELDPSEQLKAKQNKSYVKARGIVEDIKDFDYEFFGFNRKLASVMDPQHRLFLEVAFEVLDSVGYIANKPDFNVGVFAGCSTNYYFSRNLVFDQELTDSLGAVQLNSLNEKDYLATRAAFLLDLKGPAVSINTACSTALVAVANAVKSIRSGECTAAIAGASSVAYPVHSGHLYEEGSIMSKDGHCRPFDAEASGTLFSDGGGAVLLKDYEQALIDGDPILAIIKGVGINNDGADKGSFSAPSVEGQAGAIRMALEDGDVDPSEIGYVEAHGTATPIGDPIEIEGLKLAFGTEVPNQYCALGSVKGNVGHLNSAAGIVGLIKTVCALQEKTLPASIGYSTPNPAINFDKSPFYIQQQTTAWDSAGVRKAGVSSFGIGGTNCHIILEEFIPTSELSSQNSEIDQTIYLSAKTENSLRGYAARLKEHVLRFPAINLGQFGYNVNKNNAKYKLGASVTFRNSQELLSGLGELIEGNASIVKRKGNFDFPVFMFPGQGSQYVGMGRELYEREPVFRSTLDQCGELVSAYAGISIRDLLFPTEVSDLKERKLADTRYTQPLVFAISYSFAKLWESKNIKPSALVGHSIGEFVAACIAGVLSLEDAVKVVSKRGELISQLNPGSMLSIRSSADSITQMLPEGVTLAADNAPNLCVASGPSELIDLLTGNLEQKGIPAKVLRTSHAFHSAMMDPVLDQFQELLASVKLSNPKIPIMSTATGEWMKDAEATSTEYWTQHMRLPVLFNKAVKNLLNELPEAAFVEVGPGNGLTTLLLQHSEAQEAAVSTSLNKTFEASERSYFQEQLHSLVSKGLNLPWNDIYPEEFHAKMILPTYVFDKKRCWIDVNIPSTPKEGDLIDSTINEQIEDKTTEEGVEDIGLTEIFGKKLSRMLEDVCGEKVSADVFALTYFEIGLDSLGLTQFAYSVKKEFKVEVSFRQLNGELNNPTALLGYLLANSDLAHTKRVLSPKILSGKPEHGVLANGSLVIKPSSENSLDKAEREELAKPFGAVARIEKQSAEISEKAESFILEFIKTYNSKTLKSKEHVQENRKHTADPRVVSGFKPFTKELTYPIVTNYSKGSQLTDLDGNTYLDWLNGFGCNMFGYQADFINKAIIEQINKGIEIGPQTALAGIVSEKISRLTNNDRVGLCNTGSEAVLGAIRIARTISQRNLIVTFENSYHGINDEVIIRRTKLGNSYPAAAGILKENVQETLVLEYGTRESLDIIAERSDEIAAVLVEPVQSRRPEFVPLEFLQELRTLTEERRICLIFDEVITGFRSHIGGFQGLYPVKADLTTYGKVLGGGFSIGVIAGKAKWMDALDGGYWSYGDDSMPEVGVTYFAGTFVRHPLTLATTNAVLDFLVEKGDCFQKRLTGLSEKMVAGLNSIFEKYNVKYYAVNFSSLWKIKLKEEFPYSELLFTMLRERGIHIWENFPCYVTDAHSEQDVRFTLNMVDEVLRLLVENEIASGDLIAASDDWMSLDNPPFVGAKISLDVKGFPVWVVAE
ncbi:amino acid adenylation domain-containing protein [Algoriphagus sp. 4150]|uniref:polyketide synthase n=1 Tax=Algoriphagus sp. 4150 TaxID=2817756 RepID=UPI0028557932|nr:polyketide synthase [Algoriphagus sp. 4150]MDR7131775.1 amino acid adenylation domain-containing protein [Algoriphagus sp. 4150]